MKSVAMRLAMVSVIAAGQGAARAAVAADPRYPDWPCQQLKVPEISLASVWTGPLIDATARAQARDATETDLVTLLAARRTPIEGAQKRISAYIVGGDAEKKAKAEVLFADLFDALAMQRREVMDGIERFSRKQKEFASDIRRETQKLYDLQDAPNADTIAIDNLAKRLEWETRIFEDRRKTTTFVCEVPVIIEKRLFDLARAVRKAAQID